nr:unnamed protein product [uncultured bacterium]
MASVFNKIGDIKNDVKRNSFDWSHDNNFTTDLGRITPVFTELVPPNSSIRIKPEFGLRFMPMMFPIQTKMKAYLSFYKVPLRTLWADYMDFISSDNTEEFQPPYMSFDSTDYSEGGTLAPSGLGDYFGIPTDNIVPTIPVTGYTTLVRSEDPSIVQPTDQNYNWNSFPGDMTRVTALSSSETLPSIYIGSDFDRNLKPSWGAICWIQGKNDLFKRRLMRFVQTITLTVRPDSPADNFFRRGGTPCVFRSSSPTLADSIIPYGPRWYNTYDGTLVRHVLSSNLIGYTLQYSFEYGTGDDGSIANLQSICLSLPSCTELCNDSGNNTFKVGITFDKLDVFIGSSGKYPYYGSANMSDKAIKLSAYPFRAYEAIYNAYIRNTRNNPFVLNGKKTYNRWITTDAGGSDTLTPRDLRFANWQSDAYTTALTAPQQGVAPLVGLTTYEIRSVNDAGHEVTTVNTAIVDEEGNAYKVDFESNGEALKGVNYTPLKAGEAVNMQSLVSPVTSGISINDFRNVNAYQRYLELNQFRGFSYKEIIEGRFDVNVRYDALNMPEYLGGITRDIVVNPITQTVETTGSGSYVGSLGSQSGLATCFGNTDGSISVFCDEESIVMGIMYVMPMPVYDSLLPKWLTYRERLDSFNPEFDHIGYQPIYAKELGPMQCVQDDIDPNTVFGYQRPWYEYVAKPDRAHGLFLSSLRNFIMFRSFDNVPELGQSFTVMQPGSVNNVFSVTEVSDKILGQIHFDCTAQLPISRVVVPRLE